MLTTSKFDTWVEKAKTLSPEECHRLATAPLPAIRIYVPAHAAHAMGFTRRNDAHEYADVADYATTKGDR